jgi:UDP-N-acetylglucosamine--N-acetylmuramyl-(pentapeptide) pyrophosphoryl-undecaprenol N-acetylglucosamine transferase
MARGGSHRAVIVAGGTGGHLYPGIATARALVQGQKTLDKNVKWDIVFIVREGDLGKDVLKREGFDVKEIPGHGLPRKPSRKILTFLPVMIAGFFRSWMLLGQLKPNVVLGMGGYLSFPVLIAARLRKIPTLIHEQNVYPGWSNRVLGRWVQSVAVSFAESKKAFPPNKAWVSGLPVRPRIGQVGSEEGKRIFKLDPDKTTFLVFGGSLGARRINDVVVDTWPLLANYGNDFQVLHITGEKDYARISSRYKGKSHKIVVLPYTHDMPAALGAADFVICRAGASTLAELIVAEKPALLIPYPYASENHQFYNAEILVNRGGAELILDAELAPDTLANRLQYYLRHPDRLSDMQARLAKGSKTATHTNAAQRMADHMVKMI